MYLVTKLFIFFFKNIFFSDKMVGSSDKNLLFSTMIFCFIIWDYVMVLKTGPTVGRSRFWSSPVNWTGNGLNWDWIGWTDGPIDELNSSINYFFLQHQNDAILKAIKAPSKPFLSLNCNSCYPLAPNALRHPRWDSSHRQLGNLAKPLHHLL